jgi:hypothetical protein
LKALMFHGIAPDGAGKVHLFQDRAQALAP